MKNLSVVMAIHNESDVIKACIESFYELADEIIIVDGESTDESLKIVRSLDKFKKVKIISTPNVSNFHLMKQLAITNATGKWIFQIDGDEVISESLRRELGEIVKSESDEVVLGYWVKRMNYFLGKPLTKGGQYPDRTLRFYRNGHGYLPAKDVHEQAVISKSNFKQNNLKSPNDVDIVREPSSMIGELSSDLYHFPYRSFAMYLDKWQRYNKLEAERLERLPTAWQYLVWKPMIWFFKAYFRHRGYVDGTQGFIFAFFSALRFVGIYAVKLEKSSQS